ncbi:ATP-binding protein [Corynebacterium aquatimens]|uniref:Signal transduction histidine kinase n=1 Tax=Corynebacterium aquatimens TaxID=1190508 RepID=A0A931E622_9CORY|nr:ATP-binding protein [Corynebacterium aquatimens]MBG6123078.1 signal transduction histidine kinase [Corynebacterium aquatimens]
MAIHAAEAPRAYPRLTRSTNGRVVAGVAAGLSAHLRVDVLWVRLAFTGLCLAGGLGLLLYGLAWAFVPQGTASPIDERKWGESANYLLVALAMLLSALPHLGGGESGSGAVGVLAIVALGTVLAWRAYDRDIHSIGTIALLAVGGLLVLGGVIALATMTDRTSKAGPVGGIILAVLIAVFGIALLVVPLIARLVRDLVAQKEAKAASDQRADIASHLHDSVLQTLALIQKRSDDPGEVARLARRQERELRAWLFDDTPPTTPDEIESPVSPVSPAPATVFSAINTAAGEVEDMFNVRISPVTVGEDTAYTGAVEPIVLAAREAMVNAAKHSGCTSVDVYVEHFPAEAVSVYVRDRGAGFDLEHIPADRHGVRESITGRMERAGGTATITTAPGSGTEVALELPSTP